MGTVDLDTKLTQLKITVERTNNILDSGKRVTIKRHLETIQAIAKDANQCKNIVEATKIAEKAELSEISEWSNEIDAKLEAADATVAELEEWLAKNEQAQKLVAQEEQFRFEMELHEKRLKMQAELAKISKPRPEIQECENITQKMAKLPKLVISKFEGSFMDWPRFWGQFTEAIDKSSIAPISKFTYLCELLAPKVKRCVEALPFTPEGYNRAKAVLQDKYGKEPEIVKCYVKEILDLPQIPSSNSRKISEFSDTLSHCVQALETMGKLDQINGNVSMTLEKLSGIRGDLVRTDPEWETWDFIRLTEAIRQWVKRNPVTSSERDRDDNRKKFFHARSDEYKPKGCVYCGDPGHKANQCTNVTTVAERKAILSKKRLCFNCATKTHRASECSSKVSCGNCSKRHHTSICDQTSDKEQNERKLLTDGGSGDGIFPVVVVKVNGVTCRALIDSGAGGSYASAKLIEALKLKPNETRLQRVDMLMSTKTSRMEMYDTSVSSIDGSYVMNVRLTKVGKDELLSINNPGYDKLIKRYQHLNAVQINDSDTKKEFPIHVILGSGEYSRIKTSTRPLVGNDCEPVAEKTKLGWFIMSPGVEFDKSTMLLTQTSQADFEDLCRLDVLGLADTMENDQDLVFGDFKEQLVRNPGGWYETNLPWKPNHPPLPTNETGSLRRLNNLIKRLKRDGDYQRYDDIITEQLEQGVIEPAPANPTGNEFYIPHKGVTKNTAETTKLRIVYDASAKESNDKPSLNDCLHPGPQLQNLLWSVLVRSRFYPVLLTSDIQKAFLQVRIKEHERDALRFHWKAPENNEVHIYRFTRALFGLTCSPSCLVV
ncbi:uncharacterized protein LOC114536864 [Dendronephthya gigantea]|uniref:uncharacterized protein LOC114536864 n=1 Tax=Dendronephthya gigantea TaxID=151771 RepID=UPI00106B3158|nr:uncharacterized protein LOC114536864 [Dendronephthya gigantea]